MIALSWLFLLAAIATLLIGVFSDLVWVYVSIGASVLAMILLLVGVVRRKPVQPATAGAPYGPPVGEASAAPAPVAATAPMTAPPQRRPASPSAPTAPAAKPTTRKPAAKKTATKTTAAKTASAKTAATKSTAKKPAAKTTAKKTTAKKTTAKKTTAASSASRAMVVAIPERGTYHESGCRYVEGRSDTERLQQKTAQSRGFKACGVCKP